VGAAVTFDGSGSHDRDIPIHASNRDSASQENGLSPIPTDTATRRQSAIAYARWQWPSRIYGDGSVQLAIGSSLSGRKKSPAVSAGLFLTTV
jgi:hypothetical protein